MKYLVLFVLVIIISLLLTPIMIIKWDAKGLEDVFDGLKDICGID
jgi:hypothetical protein